MLAQGSRQAQNEALLWVGVLIGVVLVASIVIFLVRRQFLGSEDTSANVVSRGILDDLREARDRGDLTDEEFERARVKLIAKLTGKTVDGLKARKPLEPNRKQPRQGYDLTGDPLPRPDNPESGGA